MVHTRPTWRGRGLLLGSLSLLLCVLCVRCEAATPPVGQVGGGPGVATATQVKTKRHVAHAQGPHTRETPLGNSGERNSEGGGSLKSRQDTLGHQLRELRSEESGSEALNQFLANVQRFREEPQCEDPYTRAVEEEARKHSFFIKKDGMMIPDEVAESTYALFHGEALGGGKDTDYDYEAFLKDFDISRRNLRKRRMFKRDTGFKGWKEKSNGKNIYPKQKWYPNPKNPYNQTLPETLPEEECDLHRRKREVAKREHGETEGDEEYDYDQDAGEDYIEPQNGEDRKEPNRGRSLGKTKNNAARSYMSWVVNRIGNSPVPQVDTGQLSLSKHLPLPLQPSPEQADANSIDSSDGNLLHFSLDIPKTDNVPVKWEQNSVGVPEDGHGQRLEDVLNMLNSQNTPQGDSMDLLPVDTTNEWPKPSKDQNNHVNSPSHTNMDKDIMKKIMNLLHYKFASGDTKKPSSGAKKWLRRDSARSKRQRMRRRRRKGQAADVNCREGQDCKGYHKKIHLIVGQMKHHCDDQVSERRVQTLAGEVISGIAARVQNTPSMRQLVSCWLKELLQRTPPDASPPLSPHVPHFANRVQAILQRFIFNLEEVAEDDLWHRSCRKLNCRQAAFLKQMLMIQPNEGSEIERFGVLQRSHCVGRLDPGPQVPVCTRSRLLKRKESLVKLLKEYQCLDKREQMKAMCVYKRLRSEMNRVETQLRVMGRQPLPENNMKGIFQQPGCNIFIKPMIRVMGPFHRGDDKHKACNYTLSDKDRAVVGKEPAIVVGAGSSGGMKMGGYSPLQPNPRYKRGVSEDGLEQQVAEGSPLQPKPQSKQSVSEEGLEQQVAEGSPLQPEPRYKRGVSEEGLEQQVAEGSPLQPKPRYKWSVSEEVLEQQVAEGSPLQPKPRYKRAVSEEGLEQQVAEGRPLQPEPRYKWTVSEEGLEQQVAEGSPLQPKPRYKRAVSEEGLEQQVAEGRPLQPEPRYKWTVSEEGLEQQVAEGSPLQPKPRYKRAVFEEGLQQVVAKGSPLQPKPQFKESVSEEGLEQQVAEGSPRERGVSEEGLRQLVAENVDELLVTRKRERLTGLARRRERSMSQEHLKDLLRSARRVSLKGQQRNPAGGARYLLPSVRHRLDTCTSSSKNHVSQSYLKLMKAMRDHDNLERRDNLQRGLPTLLASRERRRARPRSIIHDDRFRAIHTQRDDEFER